tara:strand:+ start:1236 stop:1517 length:282 start_codon:yes stop_codon:yes gene_type:complete
MQISVHKLIVMVPILVGLLMIINFILVPFDVADASFPERPMTQNEGPESNLKFLFAVFFITWLAFFAYVFFLSRRLKSMKQEINDLRSHLGEK